MRLGSHLPELPGRPPRQQKTPDVQKSIAAQWQAIMRNVVSLPLRVKP